MDPTKIYTTRKTSLSGLKAAVPPTTGRQVMLQEILYRKKYLI